MNPWILLSIAVVIEVMATSLLKLSDGFTKWWWGAASISLYAVCFWLLAPVMKVLPIGMVYAVWSGVGIVAITVIGVVFFKDKLGLIQFACIALILIGAVGLQLTSSGSVH